MTDARRCRNVGELIVGGKVVGLLRCELDAGHDQREFVGYGHDGPIYRGEPTAHRATLEWIDDRAIDWPEANDPDEHFDVVIELNDQG